ncbi:MAG: FG-GAP repeat domain-containing protein, partial [Sphaerospermopsis kisseleviana]
PSLSGSDFLYSIQLSSSLSTVTRVTQIGNIGYSNVWGLAFEGSTLHGYTSSNQDIIINTSSGAGSFNKNINGLVGEAIGGADSFLVSRDFNKDGKTDILLNNPNQGWNTAWIMDGTNYAGFANVFGSTGYQPVATADFNKDGKIDLVVNNPSN